MTTVLDRARRRFAAFVAENGGDTNVADLLGCSRSYVHHIRNGQRTPGIAIAAAISRAADIPAEDWSPRLHPRARSRKVRRKGKRAATGGS